MLNQQKKLAPLTTTKVFLKYPSMPVYLLYYH